MLKSMTGYGKAIVECKNRSFIVEIKTLNSKQVEINSKIPSILKDKEMEIRNEVVSFIQRGKAEISISYDNSEQEATTRINTTVVQEYTEQLRKLASDLKLEEKTDLLSIAMRLPDILKTEKTEVDDQEWSAILNCIRKALDQLDAFRVQEGSALSKDIIGRINLIDQYSRKVDQFEVQRIETIKSRLNNGLKEFVDKDTLDRNRFEQELIYYLDKLDITEEKVRLRNHLSYFIETIKEDFPGKKLGFIAQEIGREINTLGSKANDSNIQKLVVQMKDELEKIKEQLMNIL
jgi:uncharacterized protein (TIGR00255 family)